MNALYRWLKFNLVGALGMAVQLATLAALIRIWPGHYLVASALALELTLLHNFIWHTHYTWSDRQQKMSSRASLLRFHLTNGLVSLTGNLILMRLLVEHTHMPVLAANTVAVAFCSLFNFALSDRWTFRRQPTPVILSGMQHSLTVRHAVEGSRRC